MKNPSLDIIVTERCSTGGCPLEEACEHCYLIQSAISVATSYIISVYCEDYAGYFTVILSFLAFHFCSAYFIYLVSCKNSGQRQWVQNVTWSIDHLHQHWMIKLHTRYGLERNPLFNILECLVLMLMYMFQRKIGVSWIIS
jgi:hypothetical protein